MERSEKERIVAELAERLRAAESLLVADYRGLTMTQIDGLRGQLLENGARFTVVKNTLTRRAAEEAGMNDLLELLDGPTAIAFLEPDADPVAAAKVVNEAARTTRILLVKGGILEGKTISEGQVRELATVPPLDVLRGQVLGAIVAPLTALMGLLTAPLQNLAGLVDARIEQLGEGQEAQEPEAREPEPQEPEAQEPEAQEQTEGDE